MVTEVRKSALPTPAEVPERLRDAALAAASISLRELRLQGFPVFFTDWMEIIEPVVACLHKRAIQRAHTIDTLPTVRPAPYLIGAIGSSPSSDAI